MIARFLFFFAVILLVNSCSTDEQQPNVSIKGHFPEMAGMIIYFEELEPLRAVQLDSVKIGEGGDFSFDAVLSDAGFYLLKTSVENRVLLQLEGGEQLELRGDGPTMNDGLQIKGSPGSSQIQEFEVFMSFQRKRIDSLAVVYNDSRGQDDFFTIKQVLDSLYLGYVEDQRTYVFSFLDSHPGSLVNLILINRKLGTTSVIDENDDFLHLYRIDSILQLSYPGNKHVADHHERVKAIRGELFDSYVFEEKLSPGKKAPDVVLNDTAGQPVSLKSYTGKEVILYFWAGWDARSRKDNRKLVNIYPELKARNVEILGISLDENEVVWKGAIRLDGLTWPQLSELKGYYSKISKAYNVPEDLPFYYLIDNEQKIKYKHAHLDSLLVHLN